MMLKDYKSKWEELEQKQMEEAGYDPMEVPDSCDNDSRRFWVGLCVALLFPLGCGIVALVYAAIKHLPF